MEINDDEDDDEDVGRKCEMGNSKWDSELARLSTYWSARNGKW